MPTSLSLAGAYHRTLPPHPPASTATRTVTTMAGRRAIALALALLFAPAASFVPASRPRALSAAVRPLHVASLDKEGLSEAEQRVKAAMEAEVRSGGVVGGGGRGGGGSHRQQAPPPPDHRHSPPPYPLHAQEANPTTAAMEQQMTGVFPLSKVGYSNFNPHPPSSRHLSPVTSPPSPLPGASPPSPPT